MNDLLQLAGQAGMTPEQGKATTGGLLKLLQSQMDSGKFNQQILSNVPGAADAMKNDAPSSSAGGGGAAGGLMGSAMSMLGGGGGGSSAAGGTGGTGGSNNVQSMTGLLASLAALGVTPAMVKKFLPLFSSYIKTQSGGVDVSSMLGGASTTTAPAAGSGGGTATTSTSGGGLPSGLGGLAAGFGFGKK